MSSNSDNMTPALPSEEAALASPLPAAVGKPAPAAQSPVAKTPSPEAVHIEPRLPVPMGTKIAVSLTQEGKGGKRLYLPEHIEKFLIGQNTPDITIKNDVVYGYNFEQEDSIFAIERWKELSDFDRQRAVFGAGFLAITWDRDPEAKKRVKEAFDKSLDIRLNTPKGKKGTKAAPIFTKYFKDPLRAILHSLDGADPLDLDMLNEAVKIIETQLDDRRKLEDESTILLEQVLKMFRGWICNDSGSYWLTTCAQKHTGPQVSDDDDSDDNSWHKGMLGPLMGGMIDCLKCIVKLGNAKARELIKDLRTSISTLEIKPMSIYAAWGGGDKSDTFTLAFMATYVQLEDDINAAEKAAYLTSAPGLLKAWTENTKAMGWDDEETKRRSIEAYGKSDNPCASAFRDGAKRARGFPVGVQASMNDDTFRAFQSGMKCQARDMELLQGTSYNERHTADVRVSQEMTKKARLLVAADNCDLKIAKAQAKRKHEDREGITWTHPDLSEKDAKRLCTDQTLKDPPVVE